MGDNRGGGAVVLRSIRFQCIGVFFQLDSAVYATVVDHVMQPTPVATRSKAWDCGRLFAGIMGSNTAGGLDICVMWVLSVVR
jgi:hypothetical protein